MGNADMLLKMMGIDPVEVKTAMVEFAGLAKGANNSVVEMLALTKQIAADVAEIKAILNPSAIPLMIEAKENENVTDQSE